MKPLHKIAIDGNFDDQSVGQLDDVMQGLLKELNT